MAGAAFAHHDRDLVQRLGQLGPEVPVVAGAAQIGAMHAALRDHFAVGMRQFLEMPHILWQHWPARTGNDRVLIADNRRGAAVVNLGFVAFSSSMHALLIDTRRTNGPDYAPR